MDKHSREPGHHHFVPEFLLRPWTREWRPKQQLLRGYYWDWRKQQLRHRDNGVGAFCYRIDLLTIQSRPQGKAALESQFFQSIDQKGQAAAQALVEQGTDSLDSQRRSDFARLLLSLEYRRPTMVDRLRIEGSERLAAALDSPEMIAEFKRRGVEQRPSEYATQKLGWSFEERAMLIIQDLVDSREVGERIINAHWHLKRLRAEHGTLMLSDRPLVRTHGLDHTAATWFLPLTPKVGFFATLHRRNLDLIRKASAATWVRHANIDAAGHAEKYVFSVARHFPEFLAKILQDKASPRRNVERI